MQITKNHNYWLCIEPYVFIFNNKDNYLLYNGFSHKFIVINNTETNSIVLAVLDSLKQMENMYCVYLSSEQLSNNSLQKFIYDVRDGFFGDVLDDDYFEKRPVIFPPIANVKNSYCNLIKEEELPRTSNLENFLHEITIYINGNCNGSCKNCSEYCKQFIFCTKCDTELSDEDLNSIIDALRETKVSKVNIVGGNIYMYKSFDNLLRQLEKLGTNNIFYTHMQNFDFNKSKKILELGHKLCIFVKGDSEKNNVERIQKLLCNYKDAIIWNYIITSEFEFNNVDCLYDNQKNNSIITPFYNFDNIDFFEKFVYNNDCDFCDIELSCEDIFKRQMINLYDYGKLIIKPDKTVYSNINYPSLGVFNNNFIELTKKMLCDNSPWFRTRDRLMPCKECLFKYLCASPSNYEIILNRNNLCNVFK